MTGSPILPVMLVGVLTCRSACGSGVVTLVSPLLFVGTGSGVSLVATVFSVTVPAVVGVNLVSQLMGVLTASAGVIGGVGVQTVVAPAGAPVTVQVALTAGLGPALIQMLVTVTGSPTLAVMGPGEVSCMSAVGVKTSRVGAMSLAGLMSIEPLVLATVSSLTEPVVCGVNVVVQVMDWPGRRSSAGEDEGVQVVTTSVASAGMPVLGTAQVAPSATSGPAFVHEVLKVTGVP